MMGGAEIVRIADEAARKAAKVKRGPLVVWNDTTIEQNLRAMPFLGDFVLQPWEVVFDEDSDEQLWFVDNSGMGQEGELALTVDQFVTAVRAFLLHADKAYIYGFGIVEQGEFQVYVRAYRKPKIG
jgi:hypothetical protein